MPTPAAYVKYARTRQFYEKMGFLPLEEFQEFPTLWGEANPCLLMTKAIGPLSEAE